MQAAILLSSLALAVAAIAQDSPPTATQDIPSLASGPSTGVDVPPLPVYAPDGPDAGLELDLASVIGSGPGAVLFVHELTRNVAPLVRAMDQIGDTHAPLGLATAVVTLAADRSEAERRVTASSRSLRMARPMFVSVDGAEGPGAWALNRKATLTLVLCDGGKVLRSVGFTDTGRQDLARFHELIETVTGPIPESPGELRALALRRLPQDVATLRARAAHLALELHWRAKRVAEETADRARRDGNAMRPANAGDRPMQRGEPAQTDAPRRGKAPEDEALRNLLRAAIQRDATAERLDEVFTQIEARSKESAELRGQAEAMLELMLSLDYGNDLGKARAKQQLNAWKTRR